MSETIPAQSVNMEALDHGEWRAVHGRGEVIEYEKTLVSTGNPEADPSFRANMDDTREIMAAFESDEELNRVTNNYFDNMNDLPEIFRHAKTQTEAETKEKMTWTGWLARGASDQQVLNFLQWHTHRHETYEQSPEFAAEIEAQKAEYANAVDRLKATGLLHEEAEVRESLKNVHIDLNDIFTSFMFGEGHHSDPKTGHIKMVEGYSKIALWHELSHSALGRLAEDGFDPRQVWNEAVTEHFARTMSKGMPEVIEPDRRTGDEPGEYILERKALDAILGGGDHQIPLRYITRLYSARTEAARTKAEQELRAQFEAAYGDSDVLDKATAYLGQHINYGSGITEDMYGDGAQQAVEQLVRDPRKALGIMRKQPDTQSMSTGSIILNQPKAFVMPSLEQERAMDEAELVARGAADYAHAASRWRN